MDMRASERFTETSLLRSGELDGLFDNEKSDTEKSDSGISISNASTVDSVDQDGDFPLSPTPELSPMEANTPLTPTLPSSDRYVSSKAVTNERPWGAESRNETVEIKKEENISKKPELARHQSTALDQANEKLGCVGKVADKSIVARRRTLKKCNVCSETIVGPIREIKQKEYHESVRSLKYLLIGLFIIHPTIVFEMQNLPHQSQRRRYVSIRE